MKKIFAVLTLMMSSLFMVGVSTAPANAVPAGCKYMQISASGTFITYNADETRSVGKYAIAGVMRYYECNEYALFDKYGFGIQRVWGKCDDTSSWTVNPDYIGSYNPATKKIWCSTVTTTGTKNVIWNPTSFIRVNRSDSERLRCMGVTGDQDNKVAGDIYIQWHDEFCVTFH